MKRALPRPFTKGNETEHLYAVSLHPNVARIVLRLLETGLYGLNIPDCLDRIICAWIQTNAAQIEAQGIAIWPATKDRT